VNVAGGDNTSDGLPYLHAARSWRGTPPPGRADHEASRRRGRCL